MLPHDARSPAADDVRSADIMAKCLTVSSFAIFAGGHASSSHAPYDITARRLGAASLERGCSLRFLTPAAADMLRAPALPGYASLKSNTAKQAELRYDDGRISMKGQIYLLRRNAYYRQTVLY